MRFPRYKSSIPQTAREEITKRYSNGFKEEAIYRVGRKIVGERLFFESGELEHESALKNGNRHGFTYWWHAPGLISSVEPYVDGLRHGTFKQYDDHGRLMGTFRMVRGTGIDLWRQPRLSGGGIYLAEVLYCKNGGGHGFQWWLEENPKRVYIERHWSHGKFHGIEREWNENGRLHRGYPKYHVAGKLVTKRQYIRAALLDPTLPPFRTEDNAPSRTFPPEIAQHLKASNVWQNVLEHGNDIH